VVAHDDEEWLLCPSNGSDALVGVEPRIISGTLQQPFRRTASRAWAACATMAIREQQNDASVAPFHLSDPSSTC